MGKFLLRVLERTVAVITTRIDWITYLLTVHERRRSRAGTGQVVGSLGDSPIHLVIAASVASSYLLGDMVFGNFPSAAKRRRKHGICSEFV